MMCISRPPRISAGRLYTNSEMPEMRIDYSWAVEGGTAKNMSMVFTQGNARKNPAARENQSLAEGGELVKEITKRLDNLFSFGYNFIHGRKFAGKKRFRE